jgi:trigger factor
MESAKVTIEELSPVRRRLQVEVPAERVQSAMDRHFHDLGQRSRLRGFRPGKAPRAVLEKMFGDQVRREVVANLVEESFYGAVEQYQLAVVGTPEIEADEVGAAGALTYRATVDVRPTIALADLAGIEVARPAVSVTDEQVEHVLASLRESVATLLPIEDRAMVESGDVLTVDLSTSLDGGEPVRRADVTLEAGGGAFPEALERQLVGQVKGAHCQLSVSYPDDYTNPSLAGKTAQFEVDIRDLRQKQLPALDDDFARDHGRADSLVELRNQIRLDLENRARQQADAAVRQGLLEQLVDRHTFDVPGSMVERQTEYLLHSLDFRLPEGPDGQALAERLRGELRGRAERDVRAQLLLEAVAGRDQIRVEDGDVAAEIDSIAERERQAPERVRAFYERAEAREALKGRMMRDRVIESLLASAKIVPAEPIEEVARG